MEIKKITTVTTKVNQDGEIIGDIKKVEFETFNAQGAIFFQKEKRGFVIPIFKFSPELTASDIEKFTRLFFAGYAAVGTNRLEIPGTRRKSKEMDRAELAEAMGFEGVTAVKKATTLLNKFVQIGVLAKKMNGKVEEWFINPLLVKTSHRLSVDLFELFQPSLEEYMKQQPMILSFLKAGVKEKYISRVETMSPVVAKKEIAKEQFKEKFVEEMREVKQMASEIFLDTIASLCKDYAVEFPGVSFKIPKDGMEHETARQTLIAIYGVIDKSQYKVERGEWTVTEEEMNSIMTASEGTVRFNTKKASAPTEANKRIN